MKKQLAVRNAVRKPRSAKHSTVRIARKPVRAKAKPTPEEAIDAAHIAAHAAAFAVRTIIGIFKAFH